MTIHDFKLRTAVPASADRVFAWHMRAGAFARLAPPWEEPIVDSPFSPPTVGETIELQVPIAPGVHVRWVSEFKEVEAGKLFRDAQVTGPFDRFDHTHRFEPIDEGSSVMEDSIRYQLPLGFVGDLVGAGSVRRRLARTFAYRHRVLAADLAVHARAPRSRLRVLVTGSTGLVGRALVAFLESGGHDVHRLTRGRSRGEKEIEFDPEKGAAHPSEMEAFDAVIHLAGDSIAKGRWTEAKRRRIRDSRVGFTKCLSQTLAALRKPPAVLVSASAVGYYGDRGDRILRESDPPGQGFLPEVCLEWEGATEPAAHAGIRVVQLRTGLVLAANGGGLEPMLLPFGLGLGGPMGNGRQWWSFIAMDDLLYLIHHALMTDTLRGPVNATSPAPVTNAEFTKILARVLRRPAVFSVPKPALDLALGAMAGPLLFASARVNPEKLLDSGFEFAYPSIDSALRHTLGLPSSTS